MRFSAGKWYVSGESRMGKVGFVLAPGIKNFQIYAYGWCLNLFGPVDEELFL
jgi:hypothetical protein